MKKKGKKPTKLGLKKFAVAKLNNLHSIKGGAESGLTNDTGDPDRPKPPIF